MRPTAGKSVKGERKGDATQPRTEEEDDGRDDHEHTVERLDGVADILHGLGEEATLFVRPHDDRLDLGPGDIVIVVLRAGGCQSASEAWGPSRTLSKTRNACLACSGVSKAG